MLELIGILKKHIKINIETSFYKFFAIFFYLQKKYITAIRRNNSIV